MKALVQRVSEASVSIDGEVVGRIGPGLLVLLGVAKDDTESDADYIVNKAYSLTKKVNSTARPSKPGPSF